MKAVPFAPSRPSLDIDAMISLSCSAALLLGDVGVEDPSAPGFISIWISPSVSSAVFDPGGDPGGVLLSLLLPASSSTLYTSTSPLVMMNISYPTVPLTISGSLGNATSWRRLIPIFCKISRQELPALLLEMTRPLWHGHCLSACTLHADCRCKP